MDKSKNIKNMNIFKRKIYTGLNEDTRSTEEKKKDFLHEERVMASVSEDPFGNKRIDNSPCIEENQNGTLACVHHGIGGALEIERKNDTGVFAHIAKIFTYRLRSNYPEEGSSPIGGMELFRINGAPLYNTLQTPKTEAEANRIVITDRMRNEAKIFAGKAYYTLQTPNDIEKIAEIAQKGHGVPICIFADRDEWAKKYVSLDNKKLKRENAGVRHLVYVIPKSGFTENGKRWVSVQDSAHFGGLSMRHVPEEFISERTYFAGYWDTVMEYPGGPKPVFTFTKILKYGSIGNEVKMLQKLLISEKLLPIDCATGNFYGQTLAAVRAFQNKYADDILKPLKLDRPTDTWGSMCISKANSIVKMV